MTRRTILWLTFGYFTLIMLASLFDFGEGIDPGLSNEITNAGHYPAFFIATAIFTLFLATTRPPLLATVISLISSVVLAALIEEIQPYFGRSRSMEDLIHGASGSAAAAVAMWLWYNRKDFRYWRSLLALHGLFSFLLGVTLALPLYFEFRAIQIRTMRFPILSDFTYESELRLWRTNFEDDYGNRASVVTRGYTPDGHNGVLVGTLADRYSGVSYAAGDHDWSGYQSLELQLYNPGDDFTLIMRIDDDGDCEEYGDRFNASFHIAHGSQVISVPIADIEHGSGGRTLNLKRIRKMMLFVTPRARSVQYLITRAELKK